MSPFAGVKPKIVLSDSIIPMLNSLLIKRYLDEGKSTPSAIWFVNIQRRGRIYTNVYFRFWVGANQMFLLAIHVSFFRRMFFFRICFNYYENYWFSLLKDHADSSYRLTWCGSTNPKIFLPRLGFLNFSFYCYITVKSFQICFQGVETWKLRSFLILIKFKFPTFCKINCNMTHWSKHVTQADMFCKW